MGRDAELDAQAEFGVGLNPAQAFVEQFTAVLGAVCGLAVALVFVGKEGVKKRGAEGAGRFVGLCRGAAFYRLAQRVLMQPGFLECGVVEGGKLRFSLRRPQDAGLK